MSFSLSANLTTKGLQPGLQTDEAALTISFNGLTPEQIEEMRAFVFDEKFGVVTLSVSDPTAAASAHAKKTKAKERP